MANHMKNGPGELWMGGMLGIERLKVPSVRYQDGPQGFRDNIQHSTTTQWPGLLSYANSWDRELTYEFAKAMGKEFKMKGAGVQLGPALNVARLPIDGRNFEYISGEDPVVGAELAGPMVKGIQSNGVIGVMKHFVNNNQETNRQQ